MIIDTHVHLMFSEFRGDLDEVVLRAREFGVEKMINIGCDTQTSMQALEIAQKYDCVYASVGVHPYDVAQVNEELMDEWEKWIQENSCENKGKIVAIGEIGLDYFKAKVPREVQKKAFLKQLELAKKVGLPVIIHNREADEDCLEILKQGGGGVKTVFHCYGSDLEFARKVWEAGYYISLTGIITYPNASNLREVVLEMPLDRFMVETDCPYLAPQKYRGIRNEPAYVVEVVKKIAELRGLSYEEVAEISTRNAERFFGF